MDEFLTEDETGAIKRIFGPMLSLIIEEYKKDDYSKADAWDDFLDKKPEGTTFFIESLMMEMFEEVWDS
jgi:hypothetical protein